MSIADIPEAPPKSVVVVVKSWKSSWTIIYCILLGLSAGLDAVAGSPVLGSEVAGVILVINSVLIGLRRYFSTSQPIG